LTENFQNVGALKPYQSPSESNGDGTDWTDQLPANWAGSFPSPEGNPIEFRGWRVHDVDSWIATEGNQDRNVWTRGGVGSHGQVLVADPDAYDDGTDIDTGNFDAFVTTPPINLATVTPNSVSIAFDSFWKNEVTQIGTLEVSFDGGTTYANILKYDSALLGNDEIIDKREQISVNNPAAGNLVFRFGLVDGSNDWWWAIDNVSIDGTLVPEPSSALLCGIVSIALMWAGRRRSA
jgi:hypothetical protein